MEGFTETREGYVHDATGICLVMHGPVGRWGAYRVRESGLKSWLVKPRFKAVDNLVKRLRARGRI